MSRDSWSFIGSTWPSIMYGIKTIKPELAVRIVDEAPPTQITVNNPGFTVGYSASEIFGPGYVSPLTSIDAPTLRRNLRRHHNTNRAKRNR